MYNCGQDTIDLLNKNYRQVVKITFAGSEETIEITEGDIVQGGMSIDRYSVSNSRIEMGSAVAAELSVKLKNYDGKFDKLTFEGAELFVQVGVKKWDADRWEKAYIHWVPCGYFLVDTPPRKLATIALSALDRMVLFSRVVNPALLKFPMTVETLINKCCSICGVSCATNLTLLPNRDYLIAACPTDNDLTYRTLLQWCAALTGCCAFMNADGKLALQWYEQTDLPITAAERYDSDMQENDITLTGFAFTATDKTAYTAGSAEYALDLSGNGLLQDNPQGVLDVLYAVRGGFCYRPYEASIKAAPYLYPMDRVLYTDAKGVTHDTIITNVNFVVNGNTSIAGAGETTQSSSYAGENGLTRQQANILEQMKTDIDLHITERQQAVLELNQLIGNSLGLNITTINETDGTTSYYFHNGTTLENSSVIYTLKAGGFAWTDDWDNGNPVWQYGFTKDGNAVFNALSTYKINADYIEAGSITANLLSTEYKNSVTTSIDTATSSAKEYTDIHSNKTYKGTYPTAPYKGGDTWLDGTNIRVCVYASRSRDDAYRLVAPTGVCGNGFTAQGVTSQTALVLSIMATAAGDTYSSKWHDSTQQTQDVTITYKGAARDQIYAPGDWEIANKYQTVEQVSSAINQSANSITLAVSKTYATTYYADNAANTAQNHAIADTANKLKAYSTTTQMQSAINQSADSITLAVSKTYATTSTLGNYTKTSEVRSKFAMDASSVTIETGEVNFKANTFSIESDNFKLSKNGYVTATGSFKSSQSRTDNQVLYAVFEGRGIFNYKRIASEPEGSEILCVQMNTVQGEKAGYLSVLENGNLSSSMIGGVGRGLRVYSQDGTKAVFYANRGSSGKGYAGTNDANGTALTTLGANDYGGAINVYRGGYSAASLAPYSDNTVLYMYAPNKKGVVGIFARDAGGSLALGAGGGIFTIVEYKDNSKIGYFDKLSIAGGAAQTVRWVWSATCQGWLLTTTDSLK